MLFGYEANGYLAKERNGKCKNVHKRRPRENGGTEFKQKEEEGRSK
jgi:hypothetical protein